MDPLRKIEPIVVNLQSMALLWTQLKRVKNHDLILTRALLRTYRSGWMTSPWSRSTKRQHSAKTTPSLGTAFMGCTPSTTSTSPQRTSIRATTSSTWLRGRPRGPSTDSCTTTSGSSRRPSPPHPRNSSVTRRGKSPEYDEQQLSHSHNNVLLIARD